MKQFVNAAICTEEGIVRTNMAFSDQIVSIGAPPDCVFETVKVPENAMILPGFIDIHTHGAGGKDFRDEDCLAACETISEKLAQEGTTSYLPTLGAQTFEQEILSLKEISAFMRGEGKKGARMLGIHLEGPFLNKKYCGGLLQSVLCNPDEKMYGEFSVAAEGNIRLITLAPELDGALNLIRRIRRDGIVVSVGHTDASFAEVKDAASAGAAGITHCFNAQRGFHHREIGTAGAAMLLDEMYCELIADGVHVSVPAMQLLARYKPEDKLVLVTDSTAGKGIEKDGAFSSQGRKVMIKDGAPRLADGTLKGSVLKMNEAVRRMVRDVGLPTEYAVRCASLNPATVLGISEQYGSIRTGKYADFTIVNEDFEVLAVYRSGERIFGETI